MKPIKKTIAMLALAAMMLPALAFGQTEPPADSGPFENLANCGEACIEKYAEWTLRRTLCGADCYVRFLKELINPMLN